MALLLASPGFATPGFAQDDAVAARAAAGCGPEQVNFEVKADKKRHPAPQPAAGQGLVYVFADVPGNNYGGIAVISVTTRVGIDGTGVGANNNHSYFFFAVSPGDHRLSTNWQSSLASRSKVAQAVTLTAEAGKIYYFRTKMAFPENRVIMKLEPLDPAEGQLLIASSAFSTPMVQPKK
ncbi:MAG: hypothetical protein JWO71_4226 [Candidatus Acidoferrum typicum]|nr:hypothetical protein [Candidatus Acidoferrum typicum]